MKKVKGVLMLVGAMWSFTGCTSNQISQKETHIQENLNPNQILEVLKLVMNILYITKCFPHLDETRMKEEVSGQHPIATVVSCSDSRVPVELVLTEELAFVCDKNCREFIR